MTAHSIIGGIWEGYFEYGVEYLHAGARVSFRLNLHEFAYGQFSGHCFELSGVGMSQEPAFVKGFLEGDFINFTKTYPSTNTDELANEIPGRQMIVYSGNYNWHTKTFAGQWEIVHLDEVDIHGNPLNGGYGKWSMTRR